MVKTRLSVNINKIATLRNARGGNIPDLLKAAIEIQAYGAEGITVHPRPDERHIRYQDVRELKEVITTEFNIEGYPSKEFLELVREVIPDQVTLVPDSPDVLTSNNGWDTIEKKKFLTPIIESLQDLGMRVSLFVNPVSTMVEGAKNCGADRIELYTESYASNYSKDRDKAIDPFISAASKANELKIGINAGHDLNLENLHFFQKSISGLLEVSIGHALISDALYYGLENVVNMYKEKLV
jgi:pyridoxine 5-phosphate synthase